MSTSAPTFAPSPATAHPPARMADVPAPRRFLTGPIDRRTWRELGFLVSGFALSIPGFAFAIATVVFIVSTSWLVIGLAVSCWLVVAWRGFGHAYRGLAGTLLEQAVPAPPPFQRRGSLWRTTFAALGDSAGWRALLFTVITFVWGMFAFVASMTVLAMGLACLTYWVWARFLPLQTMPDGRAYREVLIQAGDWYWAANTPGRLALVALVGVVVLLLWAALVRGFAGVDRWLARSLLGPTTGQIVRAELAAAQASARVAQASAKAARAATASTVSDADSRLRTIERDLHDGTQARLVAMAMTLGEAHEELKAGNAEAAATLIDAARSQTLDTTAELREIARGIHPAALDAGLEVALQTLVARAAVPTTLTVAQDVPELSPAVESAAYYAVSELLTNVAKHARAHAAEVMVEAEGSAVVLTVSDDGAGGASLHTAGTGLRGLADRCAAMGGALHVVSPPGGPTAVTITLPATYGDPATLGA